MNKIFRIYFQSCGIIHFALQRHFHFRKLLSHAAKRVLFKICIIRGKKHPSKSADNICLLLFPFQADFFLCFLLCNIPPQNIYRHPLAPAGINHMLFNPLKICSHHAVLADLFRILFCVCRFLIQMFRTHNPAEIFRIIGGNCSLQSFLKILMIVACQDFRGCAVLVNPHPLTLAIFQVNRSHNTVPGLQNSSQLHVPQSQRILLAYTPVHILQRNNGIILSPMALPKICDNCHVTVFMVLFPPPLTENILLLHSRIFRLAQTFQ